VILPSVRLDKRRRLPATKAFSQCRHQSQEGAKPSPIARFEIFLQTNEVGKDGCMHSERMFQISRILKPEFVRPIEANLRSAAYASMKIIANANQ